MKLYIDTSDREKITLKLDDEVFEETAIEKSQRLLPLLDEILKKKSKKLSDLSEIELNTVPGSFTGVRVGVSVANTLGFALGIPVNGKRLDKGESVDIRYENK